MSSPPRYVPTLTEVVVPVVPAAGSNAAGVDSADASFQGLEEPVVQDVLRRVDLVLERRLREAVGKVVSQHSDALAQQLRVEIERVVRETVAQAMDSPQKSF